MSHPEIEALEKDIQESYALLKTCPTEVGRLVLEAHINVVKRAIAVKKRELPTTTINVKKEPKS